MNQGRIIIITGSPGTGKTTTSAIVAKESNMEKSVHMHTDDFYHYLSKGAIPPHLPESVSYTHLSRRKHQAQFHKAPSLPELPDFQYSGWNKS